MEKNNKTLYTCLGCGCGTLIFVAIVVAVVAIFFGDNISNVFNGFSNPEEMTYQGKKVTTLAEEQRLYYDSDGNVPRTDGTYKNKKKRCRTALQRQVSQELHVNGQRRVVPY